MHVLFGCIFFFHSCRDITRFWCNRFPSCIEILKAVPKLMQHHSLTDNLLKMAYSCPPSFDSLEYINACPVDERQWKERAKMKNCSKYPQTCFKPLQYHCLLNPYGNESVEVCAPKTRLVQRTGFQISITLSATCTHISNQNCFDHECLNNR